MPRYVKFMKKLVKKKREVSFEDVGELHHCSVINSRSLDQKNGHLGAFTIL